MPSSSLVLVADDDGVTRAIVGSWLVGAGYQVIAASDGDEALELAREQRPGPAARRRDDAWPRRVRGVPGDPGRERYAAARDLPHRAQPDPRSCRRARRGRGRLHRQAVRQRGAGGARPRRAPHQGRPRRARRDGRARRADRRVQPPRARRPRRGRRSRSPSATTVRSRACSSTSTTSSRSTTRTATPPATRCCAKPRGGSATRRASPTSSGATEARSSSSSSPRPTAARPSRRPTSCASCCAPPPSRRAWPTSRSARASASPPAAPSSGRCPIVRRRGPGAVSRQAAGPRPHRAARPARRAPLVLYEARAPSRSEIVAAAARTSAARASRVSAVIRSAGPEIPAAATTVPV